MNPGDIRKLLGGYAAGTLTEEERRALFEAALTDQDLFNELAREQALKELLEEPAARRQLLTALAEKPALVDRLRAWMGRPVAWVAAGSLVAAALLVVVVVRHTEAPLAPEPVITAKLEAPSLPATPLTTLRTAKDREKGAVAISVAPPTPPQKAPPEVPDEIAAGQGIRADAVETGPGGVVGGITGGPVLSQAGASAGPTAAAPAQAIEAPSAFGAAGTVADIKSRAAMVPPPIPYRILRVGADGRFAEAPAGTAFRAADRVRVVFSPPGPGRLVVTAANRPKPLLDRAARQGATINLDLPASVSSVQVTFTAPPERSGAAGIQPAAIRALVTFSIAIPREPAP